MHKFTAVLVRLVVRASGVGDHAGRALGDPGCTICNKTLSEFFMLLVIRHNFKPIEIWLSETCVCGSRSYVFHVTAFVLVELQVFCTPDLGFA